MTLNANWDLDSIFAGGSKSAELADFLDRFIDDLNNFDISGIPTPLAVEYHSVWVEKIDVLYDLCRCQR